MASPTSFRSPEEVERFEQSVGLDRFRATASEEAIVISWGGLGHALAVDASDIGVYPEPAEIGSDGAVSRLWVWPAEQFDGLSVQVTVAQNVADAANCMLNIATVHMLPDIPYVRGPSNLGDFSITSGGEQPHSIVWLRGNVCLHLQIEPGTARGLLFAETIDRFVARARPWSGGAVVLEASASASTVKLGDEVEIVLTIQHPDDVSVTPVEIIQEHPWILEPTESGQTLFRFRAQACGQTSLLVVVANADTMVAQRRSLEVTVTD